MQPDTGPVDADGDGFPIGEDCNDENPLVGPGIAEICNQIDDNCDGDIDEGVLTVYFADVDRDGFGTGEQSIESCEASDGWVEDASDCDDLRPEVHPGAPEICDDLDNDCDALVDDGIQVTWYEDADGDHYGDPSVSQEACRRPEGFLEDASDCDDADAGVFPGAAEVCNGEDDDCDGAIDNGLMLPWYADADADGYGDASVTMEACSQPAGFVADANDCDDAHPDVFPGAEEHCNGQDDDCNGSIDDGATDTPTWYADADTDGYGDATVSQQVCQPPAGFVADNTDCDDTRLLVHPGGSEVCNRLDDDCDGNIDENDALDVSTWYADVDGDSFGDAGNPLIQCDQPTGFVADNTDCDDTLVDVNPAGTEACNGQDDDCDGTVDEPDAADAATWYADVDQDGFGDASVSQLSCSQPSGFLVDNTDCDDTVGSIYPGATEYCNGADDDCDGQVDEGDALDVATWYADGDGDAFGDSNLTQLSCARPSGYVLADGDCDDGNVSVFPGATELCNGLDDDCDTVIDEPDAADATPWYADTDGDTFGDASSLQVSCSQPSGFVTDNSDCDDTRALSHPGADEFCNGYDDNCDGTVDEASALDAGTWYTDADGDTYGDGASSQKSCSQPIGFVADNTDCNDTRAQSHPGASEYCNGVDDDCDGSVDETDAVDGQVWYADVDGDSYGDPGVSQFSCLQPTNYVLDDTDCDDGRAATHPTAAEYCNSLDDNCDGRVDESTAVDAGTFYADTDGDTYGDPTRSVAQCTGPSGYVSDKTDCNDAVSGVHPGAYEHCDGVDEDCNGVVDDNAIDASLWYTDADGDTFGTGVGTLSCSQILGTALTPNDCNDANIGVYPGAAEVCDGVDQDCDGVVDDNPTSAPTYYTDADGDGYGDPATGVSSCSGVGGTVTTGGDCDDTDKLVYPGAVELCDGIQENCSNASWVNDDGVATFTSAAGVVSDATSKLSGGTSTAPKSVALSANGELDICGGTWYVSLKVTATNLIINGISGGSTVKLSGAKSSSVVVVPQAGSLEMHDLDIIDGKGCYGSAIAMAVVYSCTSGSASASLPAVNLDLYNVNLYNNQYAVGGGVITGGYGADVYMEDTTIRNNAESAVWMINGNVTCSGATTNTGGAWANNGSGVWLWDVSTTASYSATSDICDWGVGANTNTSGDITLVNATNYNYGDDVSFGCSTATNICK